MKRLFYILFLVPIMAIGQTDVSTLPTDLDGVQNGDETGIDCGGSTGRDCVGGAALKAFPGAEGAGKYSEGARGATTPTLYVVTNTNTTGAGSIGNSVGWDGSSSTASGGDVFVVFQTGGTVSFNGIHPAFTGDNITIFGQTAPADSGGFVISNGTPDWRGDDIIGQDMQFEAGDRGYRNPDGSLTGADPQTQADALSVYLGNNVIFDHCRVAFGVDESMTASNATNVTFQYNLVHHALADAGHGDGGVHSMGGILDRSDDGSPSGGRYSLYRNYVAYCRDRNYRSAKSIYEMVNNVFFGFFGQCTFSSGQSFSLIGNHWEKSPNQELYDGQTVAQSSDATHGYGGDVYFYDNTRNHSTNAFYDTDYTNQGVIVNNQSDTFTTFPPIWTSAQVQDSVLANVGPRIHKATIHNQVINDYGIGNFGIIDTQHEVGGFTQAAAGTPWPDTDSDGMDDNWEIAYFGDLDETWNGDHDSDGYLNVEEWAADLVSAENTQAAGYTVTPTSGLVTTEAGGSDTFDVVLDIQPSSNVVFDITSNNVFEGTVSAATLTFTTGNWDTPQTITVTGVDDAGAADGDDAYTVTVSVDDASSDDDFDGLADTLVSLVNEDDDAGTVNVDGVSINQNNFDIELGSTLQLTLTFDPLNPDDTTGTWSSSNESVATVSSSGLVTAVALGDFTITFEPTDQTNTPPDATADGTIIEVQTTKDQRKLKGRN
ncbi:Ig-like domain-containing protein [Flagellimonas sp.]|uniref:Ig-like domain-containing protein n=1 Tax=Flagellimonas sp. TaxID=2058762 RepID=UPI003BA97D9B